MNRIKELRKAEGISQKQLAENIGTTQRNISYWESGIEINGVYAAKIAKVFDVSVDYLLGLTDEFGTPIISDEEKAAGASATKKISISPIEEDMLYAFRQVGSRRGEAAQRAIIDMVEKML